MHGFTLIIDTSFWDEHKLSAPSQRTRVRYCGLFDALRLADTLAQVEQRAREEHMRRAVRAFRRLAAVACATEDADFCTGLACSDALERRLEDIEIVVAAAYSVTARHLREAYEDTIQGEMQQIFGARR